MALALVPFKTSILLFLARRFCKSIVQHLGLLGVKSRPPPPPNNFISTLHFKTKMPTYFSEVFLPL